MRDLNNNEQPFISRERLTFALVIALLALAGVRRLAYDPERQFCIDSAVSYPDLRVGFYPVSNERTQGCIYYHPNYGKAEDIINPVY